ncbi:ABC-type phosphate transport system substrate-binding protein [Prauserella shujinwangii]|uniref:ABC-type phosphate transport system substrate-binding protein n=1 Tax=Prauserella shujinwangii TaxID=1453103 RepID=A0A2T0M134_9PSEU|nr:substrate-binding domain-containing protein [Prauserella shujinwangii]PRX50305.1 ABC-type phosphate transport system substrate-binding protein [Prauserella shujinwangii]
MGPGQTLQALAELLGSGQGSVVLGVAALLAIASPIVDRYVIRRKRVHYRVQYNSKIGLSPVDLHDGNGAARHADPRLLHIAELLDRMSIVVIRVRNTGSFDIEPKDFGRPLEFTFGRRVIWDARISEPSVEEHRGELTDALEFFSVDGDAGDPGETGKLTKVRTSLGQRLSAWLGNSASGEPPPAPPPQWHGVRLSRLSLERKEKFKLVVVLREPDGNRHGEITKVVERSGHLPGGRIKDDRKLRRITWPVVTATFGVLLTGALLATVLTSASRQVTDPTLQCADGTLRIVGSSAFTPAVSDIAGEYSRVCGADVTTEATGSIDGVRLLANLDQAERGTLAALSDGRAGEPGRQLVAQAVAVIVYTVVVNDSVGVDRLTLEQVRGIHSGRYRDWNQIRRGPSLPIRIVGRGQESGSRRTFERTVLDGPEGGLSSDSCERRDRGASAPVIRCERGSEADVLAEVADTEGAIGYADLPSARAARTGGLPITVVELDENYPDVSDIPNGYPFWTIEYLYTLGVPENGSLLRYFIDYLRSGTARAALQDAGYVPCVRRDGRVHHLCRG